MNMGGKGVKVECWAGVTEEQRKLEVNRMRNEVYDEEITACNIKQFLPDKPASVHYKKKMIISQYSSLRKGFL